MDTAAHVADDRTSRASRSSRTRSSPTSSTRCDDDLVRLEHDLGIEPATNSFEGEHTWRIYNLLVHGDLYERIPVHPNVLPVVEGVLDRGCLVSSLSSIAIGPGESAQPIHADDQLIPLPKPHPPTVCNTMWALTDFTEDNGATRLVPGLAPARPQPELRPGLPVDPRRDGEGIRARVARQPLARRRREPHGRTPGRHRHELLRRLHPPAGEPAARASRSMIARGFSPRLRELVGYGIYNGLIGHIDKHDPAELLLDADADTHLVWDAV